MGLAFSILQAGILVTYMVFTVVKVRSRLITSLDCILRLHSVLCRRDEGC